MVQFIVQLLVSALLIMLVGNIVKGIVVRDMGSALLAALVLGRQTGPGRHSFLPK